MNRKPPLAVSPRRLRPRRPPRSIPSLETPLPKTAVKPQAPLHSRHSLADETIFRHKYLIDLKSPETKSKDDFAAKKDPIMSTGPMFERGRFYDVYSAHRNERLKRKMMDISKETAVQFLEVGVEHSKKSNFKKIETPRKSLPVSIASSLRSPAVRSSKVPGEQNGFMICDLVTVSRLLNATLVIPEIQDSLRSKGISSKFKSFSYIYNEEQFIAALTNDLVIVKNLPYDLRQERKKKKYPTFSIRHSASPAFYIKEVLPKLKQSKVVGLLIADGGCLEFLFAGRQLGHGTSGTASSPTAEAASTDFQLGYKERVEGEIMRIISFDSRFHRESSPSFEFFYRAAEPSDSWLFSGDRRLLEAESSFTTSR